MKLIKLSQGKQAIVDDEDYESLNMFKWCVSKRKYNYYVERALPIIKGERHKIIKIHRVIMNAPADMVVDHINGNGLDNRKKNLRICSQSQNKINAKNRKDNTSGFRGVSRDGNGWRVQIETNGKGLYFGTYKSKLIAKEVYESVANKYHGEFRRKSKRNAEIGGGE